jgi:hypothetical protein
MNGYRCVVDLLMVVLARPLDGFHYVVDQWMINLVWWTNGCVVEQWMLIIPW